MSSKYPGGIITAGADTSYSVAFDGTEDYVKAPAGAAFAYGTGAFTIEGWVYLNALLSTSGNGMIIFAQSVNGSNYLLFTVSNTSYEVWLGGSSRASESVVLPLNTWIHLAAVRESGGAVKLYRNGLLVATGTDSTNLNNETYVPTIGGYTQTAIGDFRGFISNFRVVKGTAVYTSNFTPPNQLLPVPGTSLLTCQSPTIIDNSGTNVALTVVGNATVSTHTPFTGYKGFDPAMGSAANGVWSIEEATNYQSNREWPIYDPYFKNTTLLLHGNGANTATNSSFTDSSSNNFAITRNGNTTQGTFSPFSPTGWSTYFLRSNTAYLGLPNASVATGSNDFSIEAFIYPLDRANSYSVFGGNTDRSTAGGSSITLTLTSTNGYMEFTGWFGGSAVNLYSPTIPINTWTHFVVCRTGTTIAMFINGVRVSTVACSGSINAGSSSNNPSIGSNGTGSADNFTGFISNFRMIIGSGVYNTNQQAFTVPTAPLTATTNTRVLACRDNRFVDNSANNYTITPSGSPQVQAFSPFVPAYITPTTYSNWFDGTGDYLTVPNAAWMNLGTSDFTMECWTQFNTVGSTQMFVSNSYNAGTGGGGWAFLYRQDNTTLKFSVNSNVSYEKTFAPVVGRWYHVAVCRSGTDLRLFVDGTQIGTTSTSSDNIAGASSTLFIGSNETNALPINGLISNLRIVKGTALYTTNFTPSSAPLTAITNTQLLTCQDSTFKDNSVNGATFTAYGNVQPVSSPTPYPPKVDQSSYMAAYHPLVHGGSGYFDGTGDYLSVSSATALQLSTGTPFTIEAWVYPTSLPSDNGILGKRPGSGGGGTEWQFFFKNDRTLHLYNGSNDYGSGTAISGVNQWVHAAVSWDLTTLRFFLNGVLCSTTHNGIALGTAGSSVVTVGGDYPNGELWIGYLNGVRLVNGTALYTKSFSPPTIPFTAIANTSLLCNFTNASIVDSTAKHVVETIGTAKISTVQSKFGGSSMTFDGSSSSFLSVPFSRNLDLSTGAPDWTMECWVYVNSFSNAPFIFNKGGLAAVNYTNYGFAITDAGLAYMHLGNNGGESSYNFGTLATGVWYNLVGTRRGSTIQTYLNGQLKTSSTIGTTMTDNGQELFVGCLKNLTTNVLSGYINDLRITKGVYRYNSNFIPQTSVWQNQ